MSGQKSSRELRLKGKIAAAALAVVIGAPALSLAGPPQAQPLNLDPHVHWFAAWDENTAPGSTDFFATPRTAYNTSAQIQTVLNGSALINKPLGIKVEQPLTSTYETALFNTKYPMPNGPKAISYVFGDFESGTVATQVTNVKNLVNQVRGSSWSKNAYVGNFDLTPLKAGQDPSRRGPQSYLKPDGNSYYNDSKANMANTLLYPGSPTFRNKSTFDWPNANIRTGLFVGPIERMTAVQNVLNKSYHGDGGDFLKTGTDKDKQIPWVARFNNWGNISLDSNNNAADGYKFQPGLPLPQAGLTGSQTADQMMGRGDFSAQILHYRMRGAYSVNAFTTSGPNGGGVIGYDSNAAKQDIRDGWYGGAGTGALAPIAHADNIFAATDNKRATMTYNPVVDGTDGAGRSEISGTIWSGVYSLSQGKLDVLMSNLDKVNHQVKFGTVDVYDVFTEKNGSGYVYKDTNALAADRNALIEAGMHRLLQFDLVTTRVYNNSSFTGSYSNKQVWLLNQNYVVFNNNNRNDVGIPEPTTFGMLAAAGSLAAVCRRHRRNKLA